MPAISIAVKTTEIGEQFVSTSALRVDDRVHYKRAGLG